MTIIPGACARLSDKGITRYPKHAREGLRSWVAVIAEVDTEAAFEWESTGVKGRLPAVAFVLSDPSEEPVHEPQHVSPGGPDGQHES